jgi:hypothetical protein
LSGTKTAGDHGTALMAAWEELRQVWLSQLAASRGDELSGMTTMVAMRREHAGQAIQTRAEGVIK